MKKSGFTSRSVGTVSAVFFSKPDVDRVYNGLLRRGHTPDDIAILMSDETLNKYQAPGKTDSEEPVPGTNQESAFDRMLRAFSGAVISFSSMLPVPGLGRTISKMLQKKFPANSDQINLNDSRVTTPGTTVAHSETHLNRMSEGGIIVSVDPKDKKEKRAIIEDFRRNNGRDILGDDGYTELGY